MAFYGSIGGRVDDANLEAARSYVHRRRTVVSGGAYDQTEVICYFSRYWWGDGTFLIRLYKYYYGPSSDHALFTVDGHTRNGNPSIGVVYNRGCAVPFATDYNSGRERSSIKLTAGHYHGYMVEVESYSMSYKSSEGAVGPNGGGTNCFHMPSSGEIFK